MELLIVSSLARVYFYVFMFTAVYKAAWKALGLEVIAA